MTIRIADTWPLSIEVLSVGGSPINPASISLTITHPDGTVETPGITNPPAVVGQFAFDKIITASGRWEAVWATTIPQVELTEVLDVPLAPTLTEPTSVQIATIIRQRTLDANGLPRGDFNSETVPTDEQAQDIGRDKADEVMLAIGGIIPASITSNPPRLASVRRYMRYVAAVGAAAQIELSYYPEDATTVGQPLEEKYQAMLARLGAIIETPEGTVPGSGGDTEALAYVGSPVFDFPPAVTYEVGF